MDFLEAVQIVGENVLVWSFDKNTQVLRAEVDFVGQVRDALMTMGETGPDYYWRLEHDTEELRGADDSIIHRVVKRTSAHIATHGALSEHLAAVISKEIHPPKRVINTPDQFSTPDAMERQAGWVRQQRYEDEAIF